MTVTFNANAPSWAQDVLRTRREAEMAEDVTNRKLLAEMKTRVETGTPLPPGSVQIRYSTPEEVAAQRADRERAALYMRPGAMDPKIVASWIANPEPAKSYEEERAAAVNYWRNFAQETGLTPTENVLDGMEDWALGDARRSRLI